MVLSGCVNINDNGENKPTEITYKYTYDLTLQNYSKFITFRYHHLDPEGTEKQIEVFFETKYNNGVMIDIEATVLLQTQVTILGTTVYSDAYPIAFTELQQSREVLTYSGLKSFVLIAVTEISGKVMTNDETVASDEKSNLRAKQALDDMLLKFNQPYNTLSTESYLHVTEGGQTTTNFVKNAYRMDPYYFETLYSDLSGTVWMENSDGDIDVYYLNQYQNKQYMEKVYTISKEDIDESVDDGLLELSDAWSYRIENGDFVVSGPMNELLGILLTDEESLFQLENFVHNQTAEITFADLDTRLLVSIEMWIGLRKINIETYYSFHTFNAIDLSTTIERPVFDPVLATQPTDFSQIKTGYLLPNSEPYYKIEVTGGTYVFDLSYPLEIEVMNTSYEVIDPEIWMTPFVSDQKYILEAGTYYIRISHGREHIIHYDMMMYHLEDIYETISSPSNSVELIDGLHLEIEGKYDEVYVYYDAPSDGEVVISLPESANQAIFYVYNESLVFIPVAYNRNGEIRVPVIAGMNQIKIVVDGQVNTVIQVSFVS